MTTIILNTEAVQALFPEGSEARVQLQATVLRKLAEQYAKEPQALTALRASITETMKREQDIILQNAGFQRGAFGALSLSSEAREAMRVAMADVIGKTARELLDASDVDGKIKEVVDTTFDHRVREGVRQRLAEVRASLT